MTPKLTEDDQERFAALREKLSGVSQSEEKESSRLTAFEPLNPMLAESFDGDLENLPESDWYAERKFDGTRILLEKFDGEVRLYTRRHVERSETLPDVTAAARAHLPDGIVLDGEVTFIDPAGNSFFIPIHGGQETIEEYSLTPIYYIFDVLVIDTDWVIRESLSDRRAKLHDVVPDMDILEPVTAMKSDFQEYFDELVEAGEEGIIIKRRESPYHLNTRSSHWQKVKAFNERDVLAVGYTPGEGQRESTFGALVLTDGQDYIGRVGSGFTEPDLSALLELFEEVDERPVPVSEVGMPYTPIEPVVVTVKYQEVTRNTELRAPVYLGVKSGVPAEKISSLS